MAIAEPKDFIPEHPKHHNAIRILAKIADAHTRHEKAADDLRDLIERLVEAGKDPARAYEHAHIISRAFIEGDPTESEQIEQLYEKLWTETAILTGRQKRNPNGSVSDYKTHPEFADDAEGE